MNQFESLKSYPNYAEDRLPVVRSNSRMLPVTGLGLAAVLTVTAVTGASADDGKGVESGAGHYGEEIVVVHSPPEIMTVQKLPNFVGISADTVGAKGLSMNIVVIPPGASAEPHRHKGYESAVYLMEGRVETRYGEGLKKSVINGPGDFLFIPPDVPHQPRNLSDTEPARAIVVRNDPNEQEHVVIYDPDPASDDMESGR
jgi:uncharacterized RmlC-like cupin family protein